MLSGEIDYRVNNTGSLLSDADWAKHLPAPTLLPENPVAPAHHLHLGGRKVARLLQKKIVASTTSQVVWIWLITLWHTQKGMGADFPFCMTTAAECHTLHLPTEMAQLCN